MIAVDTSSMIAFLQGDGAERHDTEAVAAALKQGVAVLPAPVLSELLSDPQLEDDVVELFLSMPILSIHDGFWIRAGRLRSRVLAAKRRARLADALIAQNCVDHQVPLITGDADFRHFVRFGGLETFAG